MFSRLQKLRSLNPWLLRTSAIRCSFGISVDRTAPLLETTELSCELCSTTFEEQLFERTFEWFFVPFEMPELFELPEPFNLVEPGEWLESSVSEEW